MYRKMLCNRKIWVNVNNPADTTSGQSYYSGEGYLKAINRVNGLVCVYFISKGCVWFNRNSVKLV